MKPVLPADMVARRDRLGGLIHEYYRKAGELDLTQQEVAEQAGTSHSFISKLESGDHIPTIPVLKRILAVLDEKLLIGIERRGDDTESEREIAPVPDLVDA